MSDKQFTLIRDNLLFDAGLIRKDVANANKPQLQSDLNDSGEQLTASVAVLQAQIQRLSDALTAEEFERTAKVRLDALTKI